MVDHQFADAQLAALYDRFHPWDARGDFAFYLPRLLAARSVLDVGCGTGTLLHRAREAGHDGRLVGLDPAEGMVALARRREDVEWVRGDLDSLGGRREFDLVVMTGHAFQVLRTDEEVRGALAAVRELLTEDGRFAFETRNPAARAWDAWTPEHAVSVVDEHGAEVTMAHRVDLPVAGETVSFTTTYTCPDWPRPETSRSTLRFLAAPTLDRLLAEAGLVVTERYGDFAGGPFVPEGSQPSPEIVTFARRAAPR
ncbi:methyltransferase domain-containing protein [Streptomyces sp. 3MP-14]|uniref:Methyltransferase domain-containing protein n=1 Tax=Streptomyces mimosae TaxID=2586635 RepID=A0A5N6AJH2_9ACTN|nr:MULTISPECIES: class I SAM-dependent methyltransferase [Streptomyces]KAB8167708.1 methyltransferase domain-containing protein [Streptomyces mimosae]KAB8177645.1 methyltransferase domain-containing protein [Streptomyces sp. 3MP-14]